MVEVVIKIPDEVFEAYKHWDKNKVATVEQTLIAHGTPLPKGHGRLGDFDALKISRTMALVAEKNAPKNEIAFAPLQCVLKENIDKAKTIVEADKENDNGTDSKDT